MRFPALGLLALASSLALTACGEPAGDDAPQRLQPFAAYRLPPGPTGTPESGSPIGWVSDAGTVVASDIANSGGISVRAFPVTGGTSAVIAIQGREGYPSNVVHLPAGSPHAFFAYFLSPSSSPSVTGIALLRSATGGPKQVDTLAKDLAYPNVAVSRDGGTVAYVTGNTVVTRAVATGEVRVVASAGRDISDPHGLRTPYALAPDGASLVVSTLENGSALRRWELFTPDATSPRFLVRTGTVSTATGSEQTVVADVRWTLGVPELLILRRTTFSSGATSHSALLTVRPGDAEPRLLADVGARWPSATRAWWTPQGNAQFLSERSQLEIVEVANGEPRVRLSAYLAEVFGSYRAIARLSPDGRRIVVGTTLRLYVGDLD